MNRSALNLLSPVFNLFPIGIAIVDTTGSIYLANSVFASILGYSAQQLESKHFREVTHPADLNKDLSLFQAMRQAEIDDYEIEKRYIHSSGAVVWARLYVHWLIPQEFVIAIVQDITKIRYSETSLLNSNSDIEQFLHIVSHDLQEPLRHVSSYTQLLHRSIREKLTPKEETYVSRILEGAQRVYRQNQDLLTYFNASREGAKAKCLVQKAIIEAKARLALEDLAVPPIILEDNTDIEVDCALTGLSHVFSNLISNSIKFCPSDRRPMIDITTHQTLDASVIRYTDNAKGIEQSQWAQVFKVFTRLDHSVPGSGIGLAICERYLRHVDGSIYIDSSSDQGTTFEITIPKTQAVAQPA